MNFIFQGIQIVDMPYALATSNVSLSALFPCNAYTTPSIEMRNKHHTAQVLAEKLGSIGDRNSSAELEHCLIGENRVADINGAGCHELTKEVIVAFARAKDNSTGEEEEDDIPSPTISHAQAWSALETVLAYVEKLWDISVSMSVMLNSLLQGGLDLKPTKL